MEPKQLQEKQREVQRIFVEMESYRRQLEDLTTQIRLAEERRLELNSTVAFLESLPDLAVGSEILVPVGADSFVRATLKDNKSVIVGVGADVSVEKSSAAAVALLKEKDGRLEEGVRRMQKAFTEVSTRLQQLDMASKSILYELQQK